MADDGGEGAAEGVVIGCLKQTAGGRIDERDHAQPVGDEDAVGHMRQHGRELAMVVGQIGEALALALDHPVEGVDQGRRFVAAVGQDAGGVVAGGNTLGDLGHVLHRPHRAPRHPVSQGHHAKQPQRRHGQQCPRRTAGHAGAARTAHVQIKAKGQGHHQQTKRDGNASKDRCDHSIHQNDNRYPAR